VAGLTAPEHAPILEPTWGELLCADQVVQAVRLFGFSHA
jgi:hypothetical protein